MVEREIVWTRNAEIELQEILEFYIQRNKSNLYSKKIYKVFIDELKIVAKNPGIGVATKLETIRGLIIKDYIIFYETFQDRIMVLKVWDTRQNPNKLNIPR